MTPIEAVLIWTGVLTLVGIAAVRIHRTRRRTRQAAPARWFYAHGWADGGSPVTVQIDLERLRRDLRRHELGGKQ